MGKRKKRIELTATLKLRALQQFRDTPSWEITAVQIQRKMALEDYGLAQALRDWLLNRKSGGKMKTR